MLLRVSICFLRIGYWLKRCIRTRMIAGQRQHLCPDDWTSIKALLQLHLTFLSSKPQSRPYPRCLLCIQQSIDSDGRTNQGLVALQHTAIAIQPARWIMSLN